MAQVKLTVLVASDYQDRILEVADKLRTAGMQVDQIMDAAGVITGSYEASQVAALSRLEGVAHVEAERGFQLPPPNSPLQ